MRVWRLVPHVGALEQQAGEAGCIVDERSHSVCAQPGAACAARMCIFAKKAKCPV